MKNLLTAIATGGALGGLNTNPTGLPTEGGGAQAFGTQFQQNLTAGAAEAVIGIAINGSSFEENLKESLKNALLDTIAAQGAYAVGDLTKDGTLNDFTNKLAHAIAGCAAGAPRTGGSNLASQAGANAAANNYISHSPRHGSHPDCRAPRIQIAAPHESALQLITGKSSLTGEEANRILAAIVLVPIAGGIVRKVCEPVVETLTSVLRALDGPAFKTTHYAARLEAKGVNVARAEAAVAKEVTAMRLCMEVGGSVSGRMMVDGVQIEYRVRILPDGSADVGTIFPVQ